MNSSESISPPTDTCIAYEKHLGPSSVRKDLTEKRQKQLGWNLHGFASSPLCFTPGLWGTGISMN